MEGRGGFPSVRTTFALIFEWLTSGNRYLYRPTLACDANFRLKNLVRRNERHDPELGDGLGYFVKKDDYKEHLARYVNETDVRLRIVLIELALTPTTD